jgi:adenylate cyclase
MHDAGENSSTNHPPSAVSDSGPMLRQATVLFADLRGFSSLTAVYLPEVVFDLLNRCFIRMTEVADRHQGSIDKFTGDGIMVVFSRDGASPAEDARNAVLCALEMQVAMDATNQAHRAAGSPELYLGIGINSGQVMAGRLGSRLYSTRTVIGEEVNVAARIEAFGLRGQILISESTYGLCGEYAETGEPMEVYVKGRRNRVTVRALHSIPSAGKTVPRQERRSSPRVAVRVPFSYQIVANDMVSQLRANGTIVDIGYGGLRIEADHKLALFEEIKLEFELPLIGERAEEIYGRIVNVTPDKRRRQFGVEFTSLSDATSRSIRSFVHLLIQGTGSIG